MVTMQPVLCGWLDTQLSIQEAIRQAGHAGRTATKAAFLWAPEMDDQDEPWTVCMVTWKAVLALVVAIALGFGLRFVLIGGLFAAGDAGWWLAPNKQRPAD